MTEPIWTGATHDPADITLGPDPADRTEECPTCGGPAQPACADHHRARHDYRGYHIERASFYHDGYDGAPDAHDPRCGYEATEAECRRAIDEIEDDLIAEEACRLAREVAVIGEKIGDYSRDVDALEDHLGFPPNASELAWWAECWDAAVDSLPHCDGLCGAIVAERGDCCSRECERNAAAAANCDQ